MNKILVLLTGGTIACEKTNSGLIPLNGEEYFKNILKEISNDEFDVKELMSIDSSDMGCAQWNIIGDEICKNKDLYTGIIVCHGTDTMAYTASALSFMLQNIHIPVVLTGSQRPACEKDSDGYSNISLAIKTAKSGINGVFVAFYNKVISGTHCVKTHTLSDNAFESINYPYTAILKSDHLEINYNSLFKSNSEFKYSNISNSRVLLLKLTPDMDTGIFEYIIKSKFDGIIIEGFGLGGMSFKFSNTVFGIEKLIKNNIPVVLCSQCLYEESNFKVYESGLLALNTGAIESGIMTTEAVYAKLKWVLTKTHDMQTIKKYFETNLVGELGN